MQLENQDVVSFLSGGNSVRDGNIIGLSILPGETEWDYIIQLVFNVPNGSEGNLYNLRLSGRVLFDYNFTSEYSPRQIPFAKCLWTEHERFYLSIDPWKESERFKSEQDNDWFESQSVTITVELTSDALWSS